MANTQTVASATDEHRQQNALALLDAHGHALYRLACTLARNDIEYATMLVIDAVTLEAAHGGASSDATRV